MAKNPRKPLTETKKHLARVERERRQTRIIVTVSLVVLALVVLLVGYGVLNQTVLKSIRPVAIVNGEKISTSDFHGVVRYSRYSLVTNAEQNYQFAQWFGSDANTLMSFASQLQQIQAQLVPNNIGEQTLNRMVEDVLIRQEAERRGITVTDQAILTIRLPVLSGRHTHTRTHARAHCYIDAFTATADSDPTYSHSNNHPHPDH